MSTRSNRFSASFQPLRTNMRTLKTAFSPPRSSRSASTTSYSSTSTTSPLTQRHASPSSHSRNPSPQSIRSAHSLADVLALRRRPSDREFELHQERQAFAVGLQVLEPRPREAECAGAVGIFEVLDGKC